jgi:hypothetical protein
MGMNIAVLWDVVTSLLVAANVVPILYILYKVRSHFHIADSRRYQIF